MDRKSNIEQKAYHEMFLYLISHYYKAVIAKTDTLINGMELTTQILFGTTSVT